MQIVKSFQFNLCPTRMYTQSHTKDKHENTFCDLEEQLFLEGKRGKGYKLSAE